MRLDDFADMLRRYPRPERRLTAAEANSWMSESGGLGYNFRPAWSARDLALIATKDSASLRKIVRQRPRGSRWETQELYFRKDRDALPDLQFSAVRGNVPAVIVINRIEPNRHETLAVLAKDGPEEVRALAGVLLGVRGNRLGVPGMRISASKYPLLLHGSTIPNLIRWEDKNDPAKLREYFKGGQSRRLTPILTEVNTKASIDVLFELSRKPYQGDRTWAIREIVRLSDPRVRTVMRTAALDAYPHLREIAANWFRENGNRSDLPTIRAALKKPPSQAKNTGTGSGWEKAMRSALLASANR